MENPNQQEFELKQAKIDGPTFRALRNYFDEWGKKDPTLLRNSQRDVERGTNE